MKKTPQQQRNLDEQGIEESRRKSGVGPKLRQDHAPGQPENGGSPPRPESPATFPDRRKLPGNLGLANEARPGLGTRPSDADAAAARAVRPIDPSGKRAKPRITTHTYEEPRPEPREQSPDSFAHEEERSTGVSGHSGNT